ncbi:hypothetical protein SAMN04489810_3524 [Microbacterium pygmaeum]|uniref:Uncharacterized protein n=1 Tax=Microbacterium pygmaeum TaxID=370764 RepID=A0A1G8E499_9MICO|nr:hypothetical protein SAMN04489810_0011 [Microbacterium pygmaeum]SDH64550.1 hypothetical protein SAMN04489810_3524 [Microbacterium pygmaeum]
MRSDTAWMLLNFAHHRISVPRKRGMAEVPRRRGWRKCGGHGRRGTGTYWNVAPQPNVAARPPQTSRHDRPERRGTTGPNVAARPARTSRHDRAERRAAARLRRAPRQAHPAAAGTARAARKVGLLGNDAGTGLPRRPRPCLTVRGCSAAISRWRGASATRADLTLTGRPRRAQTKQHSGLLRMRRGAEKRAEKQRNAQRHREAEKRAEKQRNAQRHREAEKRAEKQRSREARRDTEKQRTAQRSREPHREAEKRAETQRSREARREAVESEAARGLGNRGPLFHRVYAQPE